MFVVSGDTKLSAIIKIRSAVNLLLTNTNYSSKWQKVIEWYTSLSPRKAPVMRSFGVFFVAITKELLKKTVQLLVVWATMKLMRGFRHTLVSYVHRVVPISHITALTTGRAKAYDCTWDIKNRKMPYNNKWIYRLWTPRPEQSVYLIIHYRLF